MDSSFPRSLLHNFLGDSPAWFKLTILAFLIINPLCLWGLSEDLGGTVTGWLLLGEFIFTLAMALKCYPLLPGGLLALQAVALGLTSAEAVMMEVEHNLAVILLLMFMVAGIHFMKDLLLFIFTKLLVNVRSKYYLSFLFCVVSAALSAFLDALTVTAVLIAVAVGFYRVYYRVAGEITGDEVADLQADGDGDAAAHEELHRFRAFLRSLLMHSLVGTAMGGVATMIGEPQNLLIAKQAGWGFMEFMVNMAGVSVPVILAGLVTCLALEKLRWFGYGTMMPKPVQAILRDYDNELSSLRDNCSRMALWSQAVIAVCLVVSLALHVAEVGLIGLALIVLLTSLNGINQEHQIGEAFEEALPFTALLVVFFAVVSVIHSQHLFAPFVEMVLAQPLEAQTGILYLANGLLSVISDNVFVATVYIGEMKNALLAGDISPAQFQEMAVAINAGTNLPSVATPNGQAAFLFLLTSAIAAMIKLSYGRMVWMALPYTVVLSVVGYLGVTLG